MPGQKNRNQTLNSYLVMNSPRDKPVHKTEPSERMNMYACITNV